jgi:bacillithiol biosynthesis deacetylase BshB1
MADILAISSHPDDIELSVGGTLLKARDQGHSIALCDLTAGERGSRGTRETRREETSRANSVLGISDADRWNLGIPDGGIDNSPENVLKVVRAIRHFRPKVMLFSWEHDRHPDHEHGNRLIRQAYFDAGLVHTETEWEGEPQKPHRPDRIYCFFHTYERTPDFIVDISAQIDRKLEAIASYGTQFTVPGRSHGSVEGPQTFISGESFMTAVLARMRHWGFMIGVDYAEAFVTVGGPVKVDDLMTTV